MTTSRPTTTSQINDLIRWMRKNYRAARAARFLLQLIISRLSKENLTSWRIWLSLLVVGVWCLRNLRYWRLVGTQRMGNISYCTRLIVSFLRLTAGHNKWLPRHEQTQTQNHFRESNTINFFYIRMTDIDLYRWLLKYFFLYFSGISRYYSSSADNCENDAHWLLKLSHLYRWRLCTLFSSFFAETISGNC